MYSHCTIIRHVLVSLSFVLLYLLLNRPEVIFFSRIGFVAWYPAIGLVMALTLGINLWYAFLACFSAALAGRIFYAQPVMSFSSTVDAAGIAICYGTAAYVLRGPLQIDLGLRRRRDVVRYVLVSATAAAGAFFSSTSTTSRGSMIPSVMMLAIWCSSRLRTYFALSFAPPIYAAAMVARSSPLSCQSHLPRTRLCVRTHCAPR